jgi:hypothetical protein
MAQGAVLVNQIARTISALVRRKMIFVGPANANPADFPYHLNPLFEFVIFD